MAVVAGAEASMCLAVTESLLSAVWQWWWWEWRSWQRWVLQVKGQACRWQRPREAREWRWVSVRLEGVTKAPVQQAWPVVWLWVW